MEEEKEFLDRYELGLTRELLGICTQQQLLGGRLLPSPDLDDKWESIAGEYIVDGVREIAKYPTVALGWMMYVGMAVAHYWDEDWTIFGNLAICTHTFVTNEVSTAWTSISARRFFV